MSSAESDYRNLLLAAQDQSIIEWIEQNGLKNERGDLIEFSHHYFLYDIYEDWTPLQAIPKAAQVGFSTMAILKTIYAAVKRKYNVIYCVDEETELLTSIGWKRYDQLRLGQRILVLDMNKGKSRWARVKEIFKKQVDDELLSFEGRNFSALTTKDHRWPVRKRWENHRGPLQFVRSHSLNRGCNLIPRRAEFHRYQTKEVFSTDMVELLSWIFTEGYYVEKDNPNNTQITISQSIRHNPDKVASIENLLIRMGIHYKRYPTVNGCVNFRISGTIPKQVKAWFPDKCPTHRFVRSLTKPQLEVFIETNVVADGWKEKSGTRCIIQKSKRYADIFTMAAILAGYSVSVTQRSHTTDKCYVVKLIRYRDIDGQETHPKPVRYKGIVWCPRTKYGTFLAKRKNSVYWTGNTLPTVGDANQFVSEKVNRMIALNPVVAASIKDKDNLEQKQVGERFIYYRGTFTEKAALMFSSDLNVYDEEDRSDSGVIEQYESRLQYSKYKGQWHFSNTSFPNVGVHKYWLLSDQKHWFITCPKCHYEQYLDWDKNVDRERRSFVCQSCHEVLPDEARRVGRWVKKWQNRSISGYWINQMMCDWHSAEELLTAYETKDKQYFYNFVLGLPYAGSDVVVDADLILRHTTTRPSSKTDVCIGVDVGLEKHVVAGTPYGIFCIGKVRDWDEVVNLFLKYDGVMVIDAMPDITVPRQLMQKYKGKVFINYYRENTKNFDIAEFKKDKDYGIVFSDRTRLIQKVIDELVDGNISFHLTPKELLEYIEHWKSMYRLEEKDNIGNPVIRWESANDLDHFVHATGYYLLAVGRRLSGEGATLRDNFRSFHGKESYFVDENNQIPALSIEDIVGKEKRDWRYGR